MTYTVTIYCENTIGVLNRISEIFLKRGVNIESINASKSEVRNITKIIIVTDTTEKWIDNIVKKLEVQVDIVKVFCHTDEETIFLENSLFKLPTQALLDSTDLQQILTEHGAQIIYVQKDFFVVSQPGTKKEIEALYQALEPYKILQFARSARIAVTKEAMYVSKYLEEKN